MPLPIFCFAQQISFRRLVYTLVLNDTLAVTAAVAPSWKHVQIVKFPSRGGATIHAAVAVFIPCIDWFPPEQTCESWQLSCACDGYWTRLLAQCMLPCMEYCTKSFSANGALRAATLANPEVSVHTRSVLSRGCERENGGYTIGDVSCP